MLHSTPSRSWGLHAPSRCDEDCPRCGWTAPGPLGDAPAEALQAAAGPGRTLPAALAT